MNLNHRKAFLPLFSLIYKQITHTKKLCMDLTSVTLVFDFFPIISLIQWNSRIKWFYSPRLQKETIYLWEIWPRKHVIFQKISFLTVAAWCNLTIIQSLSERKGEGAEMSVMLRINHILVQISATATMNTSTEDDCSLSVAGHEDEGLMSQHLRGEVSYIVALS